MTGRPFYTSSPKLLVYVLLFTTCSVRTVIYESIHWSPLNPKFKFTDDQFKNKVAYYRKSVLLSSKISFVCPNPTTIFGTITTSVAKEELNENLWIVDKSSFDSCNIDRNKKANKLIMKCRWSIGFDILQYKEIIFLQYSGSVGGLEFQRGQEYYLIATSDGSKSSLNSTTGGHCRDRRKGISMRIIFYVCRNASECNSDATDIDTTPGTPNITTQQPPSYAANRRSSPSEFMTYLTIGFGVAFALSVLVIVILIICCIHKPSRTKRRDVEDGYHLANSETDKQCKQHDQQSHEYESVPAEMESKGLQAKSVGADDKQLLNAKGNDVPKSVTKPAPKAAPRNKNFPEGATKGPGFQPQIPQVSSAGAVDKRPLTAKDNKVPNSAPRPAPRNSPSLATKGTGRYLNNSKAGDKNGKRPQGPPPSVPKSQRDAPKAPAAARV